MKKKQENTGVEFETTAKPQESKVKTFFKKSGKWIKELFTGKSDNKVQDIKPEKVPLIKTLKVFKGVKLPWLWIGLQFVFAIAHAILTFSVVAFVATAIDSSGAVPTKELTEYVVSGVAVGVLLVLTTLASGYAQQKINHELRSKLWDKILKLRQRELGIDGGEILVSRVTADCEYACKYFTDTITALAKIVQLIYYFVNMFQIDVTMSTYALIFVPVSVLLGWLLSLLKYKVAVKKQGFLAMSTSYLVERTKDIALIKTCNAQQKEIEVGNDYFNRQYTNQMQTGFVQYFNDVINKLIELMAIVLPFLVGASLFASGDITIGILVLFQNTMNDCKTIFSDFIKEVGIVKEANGATARMSKILEYSEEDLTVGINAPQVVEDLKFEDVEFSYVKGKEILKKISFVIPKNKVTAILGRNGSGKTTAFKMFERLYEPNAGTIKYGEDNIADYSLQSWRDKICLISQGGSLMSGTLKSNICYGRDDVTDEEYQQALKLSHVIDFADNPDMPVLADGSNFSGGQRQCIAIARAMLSKKPILLLDEATCNLDAKREHDIVEALENVTQDRTTVIIAHSLSTIKNADYVVILNNGEVEATGTPQDILKETDNYLTKMMSRATA